MKSFFVSFTLFFAIAIATPAQAESHTLTIDTDKSLIHWVGKKVSGQHRGIIKLKKGSVSLEGDKVLGGEFILDMPSITNQDIESPKWKGRLETHLKSDVFFNVAQYPEGKFQITKVTTGKAPNEAVITGDLTIKNFTHPITFPALIQKAGDVYTATAKIIVDRTKWGMKYNSGKWFDPQKLADKLIYDDIEIELEMTTRK